MPAREELDPPAGAPSSRERASGVWRAPERRAAPAAAARRAALPAWASWCAALVFFLGVVAVVLGTLLQLTRELLDLGQRRPVAGAQSP